MAQLLIFSKGQQAAGKATATAKTGIPAAKLRTFKTLCFGSNSVSQV
jgi:hypothetical protein